MSHTKIWIFVCRIKIKWQYIDKHINKIKLCMYMKQQTGDYINDVCHDEHKL